jgi:hypothetical protein
VTQGSFIWTSIDHHRESRGEKAFGGRADLKNGPGIDCAATVLGANSEAFTINELAIRDDPDRQPRHIERLHSARDVTLKIRDQTLNARLQSLVGRVRVGG